MRIGRYLVCGELGRGTAGIVYDAVDPVMGRSVALKAIRLKDGPESGESQLMTERLFQQIRLSSRLSHPGIVVIFDVGQEGACAYIAMERIDGPSLRQILASRRLLESRRALRILEQTAAALDYAHRQGVLHRDLKPANVLIQSESAVKVADFGFAALISETQTFSGVLVGAGSYVSPEQMEGRPLDGRSDQFSLAALAFELLTRRRAFEADSAPALAQLIIFGPRPSARLANPMLPPLTDQVLRRGLGKSPGERFATCREFVAALEGAFKSEESTLPLPAVQRRPPPVEPAKTRRPETLRQRLPQLLYLAAVVTLCAAAAFVVFFREDLQSRYSPPSSPPPPVQVVTQAPPAARVAQEPLLAMTPAVTAPPVRSAPLPALSLRPSIRAQQLYNAALAKRRGGRLTEAVALFSRAADLGSSSAMFELGECYRSGEGVEQDQVKALAWVRRAAQAGNSAAMVLLGAMYLMGEGVVQDNEQAANWFQQAAYRKNAAGMYDLGTLYETGRGVAKSTLKALQLYEESAGLGNTEAQRRLTELKSQN